MRRYWTHRRRRIVALVTAPLSFGLLFSAWFLAFNVKPIRISHEQMVQNLERFVDSTDPDTEVYSGKTYQRGGRIVYTNESPVAEASWRILAGVALVNLGSEEKGRAIIAKAFPMWRKGSNGSLDTFSSYQLLEGFYTIHDPELLGLAWNRVKVGLRLAEAYRTGRISSSNPMMVATVSRQLGLALGALYESATLQFLGQRKQFPKGNEDVEHMRKTLTSEALSLARMAMSESEGQDLFLLKEPRIPQYGCWGQWAKLAVYEATRDPQIRADLVRFFESARFAARNESDMSVPSLQVILPCLHTLAILSESNEKFRADFAALLNRFVVPRWDLDERKLCDGDGGVFITEPSTQSDLKCRQNKKSLADNAWLLFILSKVKAVDFGLEVR